MSMQKKIVILVTAVVAAIAFTIIGITSKNVKLKYEKLLFFFRKYIPYARDDYGSKAGFN